jgi:uncharacterized protein YprB with RNaseH-like and TPR domain
VSSLADRLRAILPPATSPKAARSAAPPGTNAADVLGGEWCGDYLVVERTYSPGHRHGRIALADAAPPIEGWNCLGVLGGGPTPCLFLDLETTGLAGGAGTYAFLVGLAWFDGCGFRVRQFFLANFAAERVLLHALRDVAAEKGTVVTYNGKSFDLPLLETRYALNRMETPFAGLPHVDMLHPARRMWRTSGETEEGEGSTGCRLTSLERTLCGHEREGDVPGFEIPARYFHFVRTGDARQLEAVLEHNRLDLLSLALVTARAAQLLEEGPGSARAAREALGLGQLYERAGLTVEARAAFARAAELPCADMPTRAEALRALAVVCRRAREYVVAANAWREILELRGCPAAIVREATEALAVHHEHRLRDPLSARAFAVKSLRLPVTRSRREALEHRLARLDLKLGSAAPDLAPLF